MVHIRSSPSPDRVQVVFELPSSVWADHIFLVGDFNDRDDTATPLHQARDGCWRVSLEFPVGEQIAFRYRVDQHWLTDSQGDRFIPNRYQMPVHSAADTMLASEAVV